MELDTQTQRVRASQGLDHARASRGRACSRRGRSSRSPLREVELFIHGTTLGLNAVLERRGARTGIITNDGIRDIFVIGRGDVPARPHVRLPVRAPSDARPAPLHRGVRGRLDYQGRVVEPARRGRRPRRLRACWSRSRASSRSRSASCTPSATPTHERRAAAIVREAYPEVTVSISTDIVREHREYERTSTTVLDAYIRPIFERYVDRLERGAARAGLRRAVS